MTNQDTLTCKTCNTVYKTSEAQCPNCGEANPLVTEDLLATSFEFKTPRPGLWSERQSGCLVGLLFVLFFGIVIGNIIWGGYEGLQARAEKAQIEIERHYQQALTHVEDERLELAKAELELTLSLDPTHTEARNTLQQVQTALLAEATATPAIERLVNTVDELDAFFLEVESQTKHGRWAKAIEKLEQIRDIDPNYRHEQISNELYKAYYELGLRRLSEGRLTEAVDAFDEALVERPDDPTVMTEWEKVTLYLSLNPPDPQHFEDNIAVLDRIYKQDPDFIDVEILLYDHYRRWGDYLNSQDDWCAAQLRYQKAVAISANQQLDDQINKAEAKCTQLARVQNTPTPPPTPTPRQNRATATPTTRLTQTTPSTSDTARLQPANTAGTIYFSHFNPKDNIWEIIAHSLADDTAQVVVSHGIQPAINADGNLLAYHSLAGNSVGLHVVNLQTGVDVRATRYAEDVLPDWSSSGQDFVFVSRRSGDRRWKVFIGFADGKGEAVELLDGRTPAISPSNDLIAYQGTDPSGNQPGIYTAFKQGGIPKRITTHASDQKPALSPINDQIAFMSNRNGNWDIWVTSADGSRSRSITTSSANDGLPVWSPDGSQIAFVSDRGGGWGIYIINASGGKARLITEWGSGHTEWLLERIAWGP